MSACRCPFAWGRFVLLPHIFALFLFCALLPGIWPAAAFAQGHVLQEQYYDLSVQPLADALSAIATQSQISIAFEAGVVAHRRSAPAHGLLTPQIALRQALDGTGLVARFTGPRSAIIYNPRSQATTAAAAASSRATDRPTLDFSLAVVRAKRMIGHRDPGTIHDYVRRATSEIQAIFAADPAYRGGTFRFRISIAIDAEGRIENATLVQPSGQIARDTRARALVLGRSMGGAPPAGLTQPLQFDISGTKIRQDGPAPR